MSEMNQFVFGTGKSNLFKKRKIVVAIIPHVELNHILNENELNLADNTEDIGLYDGDLDDSFFDEQVDLETYETPNIINSELENIPTFENCNAANENSMLNDFKFNYYLQGSNMLQGGYMKVDL